VVDPQERRAFTDALDRFDEAYVDLVQSARRILLILDDEQEGGGGVVAKIAPKPPAPATGATPAYPSPTQAAAARMRAQVSGFLGDPCGQCGLLMLVRIGTCVRCNSCGWDSGCG
jgi:hypothetical protein